MKLKSKKRELLTQKTLQDREVRNAIENLHIARSNYNEASGQVTDLVIYELLLAEERLNLIISERKEEIKRNQSEGTVPIDWF